MMLTTRIKGTLDMRFPNIHGFSLFSQPRRLLGKMHLSPAERRRSPSRHCQEILHLPLSLSPHPSQTIQKGRRCDSLPAQHLPLATAKGGKPLALPLSFVSPSAPRPSHNRSATCWPAIATSLLLEDCQPS